MTYFTIQSKKYNFKVLQTKKQQQTTELHAPYFGQALRECV